MLIDSFVIIFSISGHTCDDRSGGIPTIDSMINPTRGAKTVRYTHSPNTPIEEDTTEGRVPYCRDECYCSYFL